MTIGAVSHVTFQRDNTASTLREDQDRLTELMAKPMRHRHQLQEIRTLLRDYQDRLCTLLKVGSDRFLWDCLLECGSTELLSRMLTQMGDNGSASYLQMLTPKGERALDIAQRLGKSEMESILREHLE